MLSVVLQAAVTVYMPNSCRRFRLRSECRTDWYPNSAVSEQKHMEPVDVDAFRQTPIILPQHYLRPKNGLACL